MLPYRLHDVLESLIIRSDDEEISLMKSNVPYIVQSIDRCLHVQNRQFAVTVMFSFLPLWLRSDSILRTRPIINVNAHTANQKGT